MNEYEPPVINKLQGGMMNKFGRAPANDRRICKAINGAAIGDLTARFGSPLFVFSEQAIRSQYREVHDAFIRRYPNLAFAWSYKTNYLGAISP